MISVFANLFQWGSAFVNIDGSEVVPPNNVETSADFMSEFDAFAAADRGIKRRAKIQTNWFFFYDDKLDAE